MGHFGFIFKVYFPCFQNCFISRLEVSLEVSFEWVTCRSVLLEPRTVSDSSVWFGELIQLVHQKEPVQNNRLLWITDNKVVDNVQFLAQTDRFASQDLDVSLGATAFILCCLYVFCFTLKVPVAIDLYCMNHQEPQF